MTTSDHRRAAWAARLVYAAVFLSFISVCTIAVVATSAMERNKTGFRAITVKKPISGFDTTYLAPSKKSH